MAYTPIDQGQVLFVGDYANINTPLWLSAFSQGPSPANITVSTMVVNASGGISMLNNNTSYPNIEGAYLDFNREPGAQPAELTIVPSKNVPTKAFETSYLAAVTNGGTVYDDMAMRGLQIYGNQITAPAANTGAAGYITQGSLPFSVKVYTGQFETPQIEASVGNFSTINVSSINGGGGGGGGGITDPLNISSINASTIRTGNAFISTATVSTLLADTINVSTLNVSSFALGNSLNLSSLFASTMTGNNVFVSSINASTISSGTITAGIGNFSTLNIAGGGAITNSTIATSSITTGVLSTTVGVIKEVFVSSMTFNATLSPNFDLGLGGIIGGMAGGFGANALGVGLGAAGLGTGIAGLVLPRTNGGINPNIFQTVNGTSQLQFSTIGISTTGVIFTTFIDTDSPDPYREPGLPLATVAAIPPGSYCLRTVSDPINLANSSGLAGEGIQSFSQWTPVYPGALQVKANSISSILTGNTISLGETLGDNIQINPAPGRSIRLNGQMITSSIVAQGAITSSSTLTQYVGAQQVFTSTLNVSTFAIGNVAYQNFVASTVTTSTLNATGVTNYNSLQPISPGTSIIQTAQLNATSGVATNQLTCQGTGVFTSTLQVPSLIGISSINGGPFTSLIPQNLTISTLNTASNTGLALGGGQVAIGNGNISVATFAYGDVNTRGLNSISTSWMAPNPPVPVPTGGTSAFPSGTFVLSGLRVMWGYYYIGSSVPTIDYVPNFGGIPCITLTCDTSTPFNGIVAMVNNNTATGCGIRIVNATLGIGSGVGVYWMAIGPA